MKTPSPQQQGYYNWIDNSTGSAVLQAVAGAGKTTTLIEGLPRMKGSKFFGAYNKKIAQEIEAKAPKMNDLTVSTLHAAGFRAWLRAAKGVQVNNNKCRDIFRDACTRQPEYKPYETCVLRLVSCAKQAVLGLLIPDSRASWEGFIDHFDIEIPSDEAQLPGLWAVTNSGRLRTATDVAISLARKTLEHSMALDMKEIDFDDMIFCPLIHSARITEYDWVMIDEAQDTNAARRALSLRMLKQGGRLVAVGDRHQAIYGFTGADANALDLIARAVSAVELGLTVTYRCPKAVVNHAHNWVQHIQAHETAPDGSVTQLEGKQLLKAVKPGDAVLCRFNAPLVEHAFALIGAGVPAKVEGREIGKGLIELARRWKVRSLGALEGKLESYLEKETAKYRVKEQESRAAAVSDKVQCLYLLIKLTREQHKGEPSDPIGALVQQIESLFADTGGNGREVVLLSTIHKSKGREWKRVYWLQTGPSKWARKDWELEQENNLCYVATTRAMSELILVQQ